eukprot:1161124-Pelagomonas_calceolata.AAC.3
MPSRSLPSAHRWTWSLEPACHGSSNYSASRLFAVQPNLQEACCPFPCPPLTHYVKTQCPATPHQTPSQAQHKQAQKDDFLSVKVAARPCAPGQNASHCSPRAFMAATGLDEHRLPKTADLPTQSASALPSGSGKQTFQRPGSPPCWL